jgi:hypothetical protein
VRKAVIGLGLFLVAACGGSSEKDDTESGGPADNGGEAENGGGSGKDRGGSTSSGGGAGDSSTSTGGVATGGVATGGCPSGGASTGGSPSGGSDRGGASLGGTTSQGGSGGYAAAQGGSAAGMAGSAATAGLATGGSNSATGGTGGTSGTGGVEAVCDPATGELDNTPYPDCEPRDPSDPCELCIEANCCEETRVCFGYEPGNVCGWGGPSSGTHGGMNEIDCFTACVRDYVAVNGVYDDAADDLCVPACTTSSCGVIGNATQDLVVCMQDNCEDECFVP